MYFTPDGVMIRSNPWGEKYKKARKQKLKFCSIFLKDQHHSFIMTSNVTVINFYNIHFEKFQHITHI